MALDADTGKLVWEYKFNLFQSDVPPHRVGWASPAADPETGNIYALERRRHRFSRSAGMARFCGTARSARNSPPSPRTADAQCRRSSTATSSSSARPISTWGTQCEPRATASSRSTSGPATSSTCRTPGAVRTTRLTRRRSSPPSTARGCSSPASATARFSPSSRRPAQTVWSFVAAKRAINTGVVVNGNNVIVSHGDENLDVNELGMIAAIDGSQTGDIKTTKWAVKGTEFGFSSPVIDGATRLPGRQRRHPERVRRRNRAASSGSSLSAPRRRRRRCSPTARSTSAPRAENSSSCDRMPTAAKS